MLGFEPYAAQMSKACPLSKVAVREYVSRCEEFGADTRAGSGICDMIYKQTTQEHVQAEPMSTCTQ